MKFTTAAGTYRESNHIIEIPLNVLISFTYRKIPIISPGLIFVQKAFLVGLFSRKPIIGGEIQNGVHAWAYIREGLFSDSVFSVIEE